MTNARKILLVDDELDFLTVTAKGLERAGYEVHAFDKPESALDHIKSGCKDCDVMISDIRMPGMLGFELVREVKKIRPEIKAMLMTAFEINKSEFNKVLPSTKVDAFLQKPLSMEKLEVIIQ